MLADPTIQQLGRSSAKLTGQYNEQLKVYKPDYPDMIQLKQQLDDVDQSAEQLGGDHPALAEDPV